MRIEKSITSLSWIPSEAIKGLTRLPFDLRFTHYDDPPPDRLDDLDALHAAGAFRFGNELRAWVEIEDGRITAVGQDGRDLISPTLVRAGVRPIAFQPTSFPVLRPEPDWGSEWARFTQTAGGRPGVPAPRRVQGRPFVKLEGPNVWTTLSITIRADGSSSCELAGASQFPRHWVYDHDRRLVAKAGMIDFDDWYARSFGEHSPWGGEDSVVVTTMAETALERALSTRIMQRGRRPVTMRLRPGETLVEEGDYGTRVFLVLDGVLEVSVRGETLAELGPGAIVGERALFEGGRRTATLTAVVPSKVAVAPEGDLDPGALRQIMEGHRREEAGP